MAEAKARTGAGLFVPPEVLARYVNAGPLPPAGTPLLDGDVHGKRFLKSGVDLNTNTALSNVAYLNRNPQTLTGINSFSGNPRAKAYHSGAQAIPTGLVTFTALVFNTDEFNTGGVHDIITNNSRFTVPANAGGCYLAVGSIMWAGSAAGTFRFLRLVKNASLILHEVQGYPNANGVAQLAVAPCELVAGDYIEVLVGQDSGGNLNTTAGQRLTYGALVKVS